MRNTSSAASSALPVGSSLFLFLGYVLVVALFRRSGMFDIAYHVIVLVLMGFAVAGPTPFQEIATAMLATMLIATVVSYLFSEGPRDARGRGDRKYRSPALAYNKRTGQATPIR
jgi:membrane protein implicated in regulation of membrane protease activity